MKASEIVAKFKEVLLSTEPEVENQEVKMEEEVEMLTFYLQVSLTLIIII